LILAGCDIDGDGDEIGRGLCGWWRNGCSIMDLRFVFAGGGLIGLVVL
jgi:hypothetical protein